jgi:small ligand-binding sensory domain FIST
MSVRTTRAPSAVTALSERLETRSAAKEAASALRAGLDAAHRGRPDLLVVFATYHHRALFSDAVDLLRAELHPAHLIASTTEGVISGAREVERTPGLSVMALSLPGVLARPFSFDLSDGPPSVWTEGFIRERISLPPDEGALPHRGVLMLADPFSIHAGQACAAIDQAAGPQGARIFGGLASGSTKPGLNVLAVDRRTTPEGIVGLSLFGDVEIDCLVSQGCRPIGPCAIVTRARGNEILEIGGQSPLAVAREVAAALREDERALLERGLLVGIAPDAAKPRLGRGDFIVRPVAAIDEDRGALTLTDAIKVGATIQLHVRDAQTSHDDLALLLSAQQLRAAPAAGLLFTCNLRGTRLFSEPGHDAGLCAQALGNAPLAGFHCAGEIGPIGRRSHVHAFTASLALFRAPGLVAGG